MNQNGAGHRTIEMARSHIRSVLNEGLRNELVLRNVATIARLPKAPQKAIRGTPPEATTMRAMLRKVEQEHEGTVWPALIRLALVTGRRRGELAALAWSDLEGTVLRVAKPATHIPGKGVIVQPRTKGGIESLVPLDPTTIDALHELRRNVEQAWGSHVTPMFPAETHHTQFMRPDRMTQWWMKHRNELGLPGLKFHALRGWATSQMIDSGINVAVVAERVGNSQIQTTLRDSVRPFQSSQDAAAVVLANTLTSAPADQDS